jgi:serine/threonine protein kinase
VKGTIVGSYRILGTISVGGMGTVYRAEHTLIGRLAAIKILHPELCANRGIVNRFFNEARTTSSLKHPGIVEVFDFGYMASGHAYLIMEFLEGLPLSHRIRARGKMVEGEAAMLLRGVCVGLSAAHDKGVIHRDLKPDNIMVIPDPDSPGGERVKLLDFGIAKLTDIGLNGSATRTGSVMGTPTYMSPEQCRGSGEVDHRADLYSIGCILYEMVAGRPPFVRTGAGEAIGSHLFIDPEPPSRHVAGLSPETEALIMKLLAKKADQRVQTARELAHKLAGIAQQHGWPASGEVSLPSPSTVAPAPAAAAPDDAARPPTTQLPTAVAPAPKPTTLSSVASELTEPPSRTRHVLTLVIAGTLAMAGGGLAAVLAFSAPVHETDLSGPARPAAAPIPDPLPAPIPEQPAPPAIDKIAEPAIAIDIPPQPAAVPPIAAHPADTSARAIRPATSRAPSVTPTPPVTRPAKPLKKPARKSDKAAGSGSASEDKDLLEQDI